MTSIINKIINKLRFNIFTTKISISMEDKIELIMLWIFGVIVILILLFTDFFTIKKSINPWFIILSFWWLIIWIIFLICYWILDKLLILDKIHHFFLIRKIHRFNKRHGLIQENLKSRKIKIKKNYKLFKNNLGYKNI